MNKRGYVTISGPKIKKEESLDFILAMLTILLVIGFLFSLVYFVNKNVSRVISYIISSIYLISIITLWTIVVKRGKQKIKNSKKK